MSEPKKQHYVPQTYLKNFGTGKNGTGLYVLSKCAHKVYPSQVGDTAAERHFYTLNNVEDKYAWEKMYANSVEPSLANLLKSIRQKCENALVQNQSIVISSEEKTELSINMIIQLLRGKRTRKYQKKTYNRLLPTVFLEAKNHFPNVSEDTINRAYANFFEQDKYFKEISMQTSLNENSIKKFASLLNAYTFILYRSNKKYPFITSDNPVMFVNSLTQNVTPFSNGLLNSSTIVYFPISPQLLLGAYNPYFADGALMDRDCSLEILNVEKEKGFIKTHNKKQVEQSDEYVYSNDQQTLEDLLSKMRT